MKNHVLIINPNNDTFSNPTLVLVLEKLMKEKDLVVTLLSPKQIIDQHKKFESINILVLPEISVNWGLNFTKWYKKIKFASFLKSYCRKHAIRQVIGVDPIGLIYGGRLKKALKKINLHYFSFEIFFSDELNSSSYYKSIKNKEIFYSRFIDTLLIQDEHRLKLLKKENNLILNKIKHFLIPVSPNCDLIEGDNRSKWRRKLGISDEKIVILHSGSVEKWSGAEYLLQILQKKVPDNVLILIHSKNELDINNLIHKKLLDLEMNNKSLMIHKKIFSDYTEYLSFLQISDLGLVFYKSDSNSPYTGKNIQNIGLASGKLSCFLSQEIPCVFHQTPLYVELNEKYNFAFEINNFDQISDFFESLSIEKILIKKGNTKTIFNNELNANLKIEEYLK